MKKFIISIISLIIISSNIVSADNCDILKPTLDKFYSASKNENLEDFISIIDMDYANENLLGNYEDYIKSAWEVYDVSDYEIKVYNCKINNNDAIFYFNLKSTLVAEETIEVQRNYIGVFHKLDSWKIRYVMDEEIFDKYQDAKYGNLLVDATEEVIDKAINDVEEFIEAEKQGTGDIIDLMIDNEDFSQEILSNDRKNNDDKITPNGGIGNKKDDDKCWVHYIIILSIILFISYKFIKQQDYKKLKDLGNKEKAIFIGKKTWEYLKEYINIIWSFTKKTSIVIWTFLKTIYIKSKPIIIKLSKKSWKIIKNISSNISKKIKEKKEKKKSTEEK